MSVVSRPPAEASSYVPGARIDGLPNAEYHAAPGISSTALRARTVAHRRAQAAKPPTKAKLLGTLVHTMVLEPDSFSDAYAVEPDVDGRTKAGKAIKAEFRAGVGDRIVVPADLAEKANSAATSVVCALNQESLEWLRQGNIEQSMWWTDHETGLLCKCRPDVCHVKQRAVVDLKTTSDASPEAFSRSLATYGYHLQGAHYLGGASAVVGEAMERFIIIAVETSPPYGVVVYELDNDALVQGYEECQLALKRIEESRATDDPWVGWPRGIQTIDLPPWKQRSYT